MLCESFFISPMLDDLQPAHPPKPPKQPFTLQSAAQTSTVREAGRMQDHSHSK
jgi:hypothetical protein